MNQETIRILFLLLPLYEIRRWCKLLFGGRAKRSMGELKFNYDITQEEQKIVKEMLSNLGLGGIQ